jgi:hypothetical protein
LKNDCVCYIHSGLIFIPCQVQPRMDSLPNLSLSLIAYPSIRPFCLSHVTVQSRKISSLFLCRTEADSRPQISLPNISEKNLPSARRTPHRAGTTSQTPYQILVLTPRGCISVRLSSFATNKSKTMRVSRALKMGSHTTIQLN